MHADPGATDLVGDFVDGYLAEDDVLLAARDRAAVLGTSPIAAAGGATLCFLAATIGARAVVEVGTGTGVSGLWLLRGMAPDGVLTSIDVDPEAQRAARTAFLAAGYGPSRLRLINGMGLEVLSRLTGCSSTRCPSSTRATSTRRCGCCAPGGSWSSTTCCAAAGSATPARRTRPRSRPAR